jgi:DNA-binding NtrC family response regulator
VILCDGGLVTGEHLPIALTGARRPAPVASVGASAGSGGGSAAETIRRAADRPASAGASASPGDGATNPLTPSTIPPEGVSLDAIERELIQKAMAQARNNKSEAARLLGLARGQLYSRLKRHGLDK